MAVNLIFLYKNMIDLSNEVLQVNFCQEVSKLQALKLCAVRESNPGRSESSDSLHKLTKNVASNPKGLEFFLTANFDGPYLCCDLS